MCVGVAIFLNRRGVLKSVPFVTTCQKQSNIEESHSQLFFPLSFSQHPLIMHVIESFRG